MTERRKDDKSHETKDELPSDIQQTLDSVDSIVPPTALDSADNSDGIQQTLGSVDNLDDQLTQNMTAVWGDDVDQAGPKMTVKGLLDEAGDYRSTLVIQSRAFRGANKPQASEVKTGADYDLLHQLGEGGMGVVYSARQASIDRNVAIKMLKEETAGDEKQRAKFLSEAVITGELDHPNIVPIYDLGTNHEGALFYSMKCVQGTPWDQQLAGLSLEENLDILMKVADAVAFAHSRGIIHRDLKPENVMRGGFGEVLVMDWGLALPTDKFPKSRNITKTFSMGGTPAYMAPEMALGPIERIGFPSDVYLLGAILFECVTGEPPHQGREVRACLMAAARNQIRATDRKGELVDIAMKAMATEPADRYPTVREFQDAIRDYRDHAESIGLSDRAESEWQHALKIDDYQVFAQSLFGFHEALNLWEQNTRAREGLEQVRLAYAHSALGKHDFDLGISLLDPESPKHQPLLEELRSAQQERDARQRRLKTARRLVVGLVTSILLIVTIALLAVHNQWRKAESAREQEEHARNAAETAQGVAETERIAAVLARNDAVEARDEAEEAAEQERQAKEKEQQAKEKEQKAKDVAIVAKQQAEEARDIAVDARAKEETAKQEALYQAYVASIGLAAAKIEENAFDAARELLLANKPESSSWEWQRLMYLCGQDVNSLDCGVPLEAIAVSPDGRRVVAGGWEGVARVWDLNAETPPIELPHATASIVYAVALSPDGSLVATGSSDRDNGVLRIWNASTGQLLRRLDGHTQAVSSVVFSRDGRLLLSSSFDDTARLWDVATGQQRQEFVGHSWWVWSAAFSPDEQRIVTASQDGSAMIWSVESGQRIGESFTGHRDGSGQAPLYCAAFSPDGRFVASGGLDNQVTLWDPATIAAFDFEAAIEGRPVPPPSATTLVGHRAAVRSLAFSRDGRTLISGSQDNSIIVWDVGSASSIKSLRGHDGWVQACRLVEDDRLAVSGSHDGRIKFWDIEGYEEARVLRARTLDLHVDAVLHASFSNDGTRVVTASRDRSAISWDAATGEPLIHFREGHDFTTTQALFFPGGERLLTTALDNTARVWDVTTGGELVELRMRATGLHGAAAISHDGRWIATGSDRLEGDPQHDTWAVQLFRAGDGQRVHLLSGHTAAVTAVAFSPDDQSVFSGDRVGHCFLWDRETGRKIAEFWEDSQVNAAEFSPDGSRLWVANNYNAVRCWAVPGGEEITDRALVHPDAVVSMSISLDGHWMLTSCADGGVRLWDVVNGRIVRELELRGGSATFAQNLRRAMREMNMDEQQLAERSQLPETTIHDLLARRQSANDTIAARLAVCLETDPAELWKCIFAVSISADGTRGLTVAANDRTVRIWQLPEAHELPFTTSADRQGPFLNLAEGPLRGLVWSAAFSPAGGRVVTVGGDAARLWDLDPDKLEKDRELMTFSPHGAVAWAEFSPDGRLVVTGSWDTSARIWDSQTGQVIAKLGHTVEEPYRGHTGRVNSAVFSPDGQTVLTASDDGTARLWSRRDWRPIRTLRGHADGVVQAIFSPDGSRILTCSNDKTARLWDMATGEELAVLSEHSWAVLCGAFSRDGRWIATGSADNSAIIWQLDEDETPDVRHRLAGHTASVTSITFSPEDVPMRVLTGSEDYTAILWDAASGQELLTLKGHSREITSVAFSPNGRDVLTASRDGTAIIWLAGE